jgi:hypothetical protein
LLLDLAKTGNNKSQLKTSIDLDKVVVTALELLEAIDHVAQLCMLIDLHSRDIALGHIIRGSYPFSVLSIHFCTRDSLQGYSINRASLLFDFRSWAEDDHFDGGHVFHLQ